MKKKIQNGIILGVLVLSIILNIVLLTTKVYKGTYVQTGKNNNGLSSQNNITGKCIFYDNTYDYISEENGKIKDYDTGFYMVVPNSKKSSMQEEHKTAIIIGESVYYRNSVFSFSSSENINIQYTCVEAVLLEMFYIIIFCLCIGHFIFCVVKGKNEKCLTDSLEELEKDE